MKASWNTTLQFSIAMAFTLALPHASALDRGASAGGFAYVSGGATYEELTALRADRQAYSFWLTTAALHSGAHLADVKVRITEAGSGKLALDYTMDGPWLFVALPAGRYDVEATYPKGRGGRPETQKFTTTVNASQHHQQTLYFNTGDKVEGEMPGGEKAPAPKLQ